MASTTSVRVNTAPRSVSPWSASDAMAAWSSGVREVGVKMSNDCCRGTSRRRAW
jgi:hypothetical protein